MRKFTTTGPSLHNTYRERSLKSSFGERLKDDADVRMRSYATEDCLILIQVDTFISNNKMCFDYGKEEASSKNK